MEKFVPLEKRSKKEQKEFYNLQRRNWNGVNPMSIIIPDCKAYNRNKKKAVDRKLQEEEA